jgi:hypothetical protein
MTTPLTNDIERLEKQLAELKERNKAYLDDPFLALLDQVGLMRFKKDVTHEELIKVIRDYDPQGSTPTGSSTPA